jgi:hypothetical protein
MRTLALAVGLLALAGCGSGGGDAAGGGKTLPDVRLKTLGGATGPSLASCPAAKCLTVLVAPWCGVCHQVAGDVVNLRRYLDAKGVPTRVVVGLASLEEIKGFAETFGPDALLDPDGAFRARGVPLFVVTGPDGRVLKTVPGFPRGAADLAELSRQFGLP